MERHPPDDEAWAWEVLESVQVGMGREVWTVLLAVAAQPEGWYVRLSRVLAAEGLIRDLILDGPYPDCASAAGSARRLVAEVQARIGRRGAQEHRDGAGPPD